MSALNSLCPECKQPVLPAEPKVTTEHPCTQIFHKTCWKLKESIPSDEALKFRTWLIQTDEAEEYGWEGITPASELSEQWRSSMYPLRGAWSGFGEGGGSS